MRVVSRVVRFARRTRHQLESVIACRFGGPAQCIERSASVAPAEGQGIGNTPARLLHDIADIPLMTACSWAFR
jgi:hypothetical protein